MKAIIQLDVPEWQIGQDATVYFPDTMVTHAKCELLKEQEAIKPKIDNDDIPYWYICGFCERTLDLYDNFCRYCGKPVKWKRKRTLLLNGQS